MDRQHLANQASGWFRTWFARVWKVRGGGLYACGYAVTFVVLEIRTLTAELWESDGPIDFVTSQAPELVFRFLGESIFNMVEAFIWPIRVLEFSPPIGAIILGVAFFLFPITLKKPIERWLFPEMREQSGDSGNN